jgi:hypothetical protein
MKAGLATHSNYETHLRAETFLADCFGVSVRADVFLLGGLVRPLEQPPVGLAREVPFRPAKAPPKGAPARPRRRVRASVVGPDECLFQTSSQFRWRFNLTVKLMCNDQRFQL